ncbi:hypothetical protein A2U01_0050451, partial [Trifolium medium]|nr:hypothetical protein [Trifolium medium]
MLPLKRKLFQPHTLAPPLPLLNETRCLTTFVRKTFDTRIRLPPRDPTV